MVVEECAELIKEINKFKRGNHNVNELCDEIADVTIMLEQLELLFCDNDILAHKEAKFLKLKNYLKKKND